MEDPQCVFCKIVKGDISAYIVYEDSTSIAFLDSDPLFPGHVLLCPREHYQTLIDLPLILTGPMFAATQLLAKVVETALGAEGTFVAINNRVSQTVPHLHIHVVPRKRRDGLRGFFWPRQQYRDNAECEAVRHAIQHEIQKLSRSVQLPSPP
ncbi:MAG: HIT family protein [Bryobacteraceae bacterium]